MKTIFALTFKAQSLKQHLGETFTGNTVSGNIFGY